MSFIDKVIIFFINKNFTLFFHYLYFILFFLLSDGGLYTCQAMNDVATVQHTARINVYGRPTIRRMPNITAVAGESISITCPVGGYPIDSIVWERGMMRKNENYLKINNFFFFKDSVRLPYNHRQKVFTNGTLTVNELERVTDEGIYTCIARNKEDVRSSAKTSFSLRVFGIWCFSFHFF